MKNATQILNKFAEINTYVKKHPNFLPVLDSTLTSYADASIENPDRLEVLFVQEFFAAFEQSKIIFAQQQEPAVQVPATAPAAGHLSTKSVNN
jgi:hypothetical protein